MLILKILLSNIKSFDADSPVIEFAPGVNFLHGPNGSGKSTILESIGLALFNYNPYARLSDMVRHGSKTGTITIWFDPGDGKVYRSQRKIGATQSWVIYDDEDDLDLIGGNVQETERWLANLMGFRDAERLGSLFSDILGVYQGEFTTWFRERRGKRRQSHFDPILGVDIYENAYTSLRPLENELYNVFYQDQKSIIDRARTYLDDHEDDPRRAEELDREIKAFTRDQQQAEKDMEDRRADVLRWEEARERLTRARQEVETAKERSAAGSKAEEAARRAFEGAEKALAIVERSKTGHADYVKASSRWQELDEQRKLRDDLKKDLNEKEKDVEIKEREIGFQTGDIEERAGELEGKQKETGREIEREFEFLAKSETGISEARRLVADGENRCNLLDQRRETIIPPLKQACDKMAGEEETRAKYAAQAAELFSEKDQEELERCSRIADRVNAHLTTAANIEARIGRLEGGLSEIKRHSEAASRQVCPFLEESCDRISSDVFAERIRLGEQELQLTQDELKFIQSKLADAETARPVMEDLRDRRVRAAQLLEEATKAEIRGLDLGTAFLSQESRNDLAAGLAELELSLPDAIQPDEDVLSVSSLLEAMRATVEAVQNALEQGRKKSMQRLDASRQELLRAEKLVSDANVRLESLKKREEEHRAAHRDIEKRREHLALMVKSLPENKERLKELRKKMESFAELDEEMRLVSEQMERNRTDHETYQQHIREAEQFESLNKACKDAREAAASLHRELDKKNGELKAAESGYEPESHKKAREAETETLRKLETIRVTLAQKTTERENLEPVLERMKKEREALDEAGKELTVLQETRDVVNTVRSVLKALGPRVAGRLLAAISRQATRYYQSLSQAPVLLTWSGDYQVFLETPGEGTREFLQLSGGEQMSAALSIQLALARNFGTLGFCIFDEPTQNLDENRCANLSRSISRIRSEHGFQQLLLVSHDDTFGTEVEHIIELRKVDGRTTINS